MNVRFEVVVTLDHEQIALEGKRRGYSLERARQAVLADVECTLFDSIRHRDCLARVGVQMIEQPVITATEAEHAEQRR